MEFIGGIFENIKSSTYGVVIISLLINLYTTIFSHALVNFFCWVMVIFLVIELVSMLISMIIWLFTEKNIIGTIGVVISIITIASIILVAKLKEEIMPVMQIEKMISDFEWLVTSAAIIMSISSLVSLPTDVAGIFLDDDFD